MFVSVIGVPAAGKTTLMKQFLSRFDGWEDYSFGKLKYKKAIIKDRKVFVFGIYGGEEVFQGTDKLSMAVQPDVVNFLEIHGKIGNDLYVMEGDRLNNLKFYKSVLAIKQELKIFELSTPALTVAARQKNRTQSEVFQRRIRTKIRNIGKTLPVQKLTAPALLKRLTDLV